MSDQIDQQSATSGDQEAKRSPAVQAPHKKSIFREYAESIIIAVLLALFIRTFIVQAFKIPSG